MLHRCFLACSEEKECFWRGPEGRWDWLQENNGTFLWDLKYQGAIVLLFQILFEEFVLPFWRCTSVCSRHSEVCGPAVLYFPASWPYRSGPASALKWTPPPGAWTWCPCCRFQRCAFDRSREVSWSPAMDTNQVLDEQPTQRLDSGVKNAKFENVNATAPSSSLHFLKYAV